jgi:hypothetical protein
VPIVDPDLLKYGSEDDDAVESVEGGLEVSHQAQGVHPHPCKGHPLQIYFFVESQANKSWPCTAVHIFTANFPPLRYIVNPPPRGR